MVLAKTRLLKHDFPVHGLFALLEKMSKSVENIIDTF